MPQIHCSNVSESELDRSVEALTQCIYEIAEMSEMLTFFLTLRLDINSSGVQGFSNAVIHM